MLITSYDSTTEYSKNKKEINKAIKKVLTHGKFINGPEIKELEERLQEYTGAKYCVTVSNCTDALKIALLTLNISEGDEVITTPFTWISTAEVISAVGAVPVFADIGYDFNINTELIEKKINEKTKAIMVVNLFGYCANYHKIKQISEKYRLYVIEDAAQSFGSTYNNIKSCNLADISCTSFFPTKPLGCFGDGGAIFTNNELFYKKIYALKNHGAFEKNDHVIIGMNARLDTIQASILLYKLNYLDNNLLRRNQIAEIYNKKLDKLVKNQMIQLPDYTLNNENKSAFAQYSIIILNFKRNDLLSFLKSKNIMLQIYYPKPLHLQTCFAYLNYPQNSLMISEYISDSILNLPIYPDLSDEQINYITDNIQLYYLQNLI